MQSLNSDHEIFRRQWLQAIKTELEHKLVLMHTTRQVKRHTDSWIWEKLGQNEMS